MSEQTAEKAHLTNDEKETARLWMYAHNGGKGGGLGGLWKMVEQIIAGRADYVAGMTCDGSAESCEARRVTVQVAEVVDSRPPSSLWHAAVNAAERAKALAGDPFRTRCGLTARRNNAGARTPRKARELSPMEPCAVCRLTTPAETGGGQ